MTAPDPITISVVQHRLTGIVAEMGEAMLRTSFSQILNSSRDFSTAICGATSELVAQADHIPVHVGALQPATHAIIEAFESDVHAGDIYLLNDPYHGGSHLPDVTVFAPVFYDGELVFWAVNRAHHSDIGGATYGAYNAAAREIYQEGLRLPPLRFFDRGKVRSDVLHLLKANVRHARDFEGDLMAQIGSVKLAERRLNALELEFGGEQILRSVSRILEATEKQARAVIADWQDGTYDGLALLDDDGRGNKDIAVRAKVNVTGSSLRVDLTQSDAEVDSFVNSSKANTRSAVLVAISILLDPETPKNEGVARAVEIITKPGTIVNPNPGKPVTMCTSHCGNEIIEAVIVALSKACPERAMAGWGRRLRIAIRGTDPRNDRPFIWHMFHARPGGGASSVGDGWHNAGEWHSAGGLKFGSIEVAETRFPLFFPMHEFRPDSGGDGKHVGGAGVNLQLIVETDEPVTANIAGEGLRHGARGMLGGKDGAPHCYTLLTPGRGEVSLDSKIEGLAVPACSTFSVQSGGGGGWGLASQREPAARQFDKENGLVSARAPEDCRR
ncbi:MAG: hydantoinase B/oxoprolinase family protein [Hyphomicrobiaceae bacterium]